MDTLSKPLGGEGLMVADLQDDQPSEHAHQGEDHRAQQGHEAAPGVHGSPRPRPAEGSVEPLVPGTCRMTVSPGPAHQPASPRPCADPRRRRQPCHLVVDEGPPLVGRSRRLLGHQPGLVRGVDPHRVQRNEAHDHHRHDHGGEDQERGMCQRRARRWGWGGSRSAGASRARVRGRPHGGGWAAGRVSHRTASRAGTLMPPPRSRSAARSWALRARGFRATRPGRPQRLLREDREAASSSRNVRFTMRSSSEW